MKGIVLAVSAAALVAFAATAYAQQQDFSKVEIKTTPLGHDIYMLEGSGGNITVAAGKNGAIMVDSEYAPLAPKIRAAIAAVTKEPVRYLVNTHYHGDHTGGNAAFATDGATIVAHANVRKRLMDPPVGFNGQKPAPAAAATLPTITYTRRMTLYLDGQTAELRHVRDAHTDGDTYVYFPDANVISTGDIFGSESYPNIDVNVGGSIDGMIAADNTLLKLANDQTKIVPGHGHVATKADLVAFRDMLMQARDLMAKEIAAGKTEEQAMADNPLAELTKKWGASASPIVKRFPSLVYQSLKMKQMKEKKGG